MAPAILNIGLMADVENRVGLVGGVGCIILVVVWLRDLALWLLRNCTRHPIWRTLCNWYPTYTLISSEGFMTLLGSHHFAVAQALVMFIGVKFEHAVVSDGALNQRRDPSNIEVWGALVDN